MSKTGPVDPTSVSKGRMNADFSPQELGLIKYSQEAIVKYNQIRHAHRGIDTLYSFLLANSGVIYDGASYEPNIPHASVCAERCAIATMVLMESYEAKIVSIVVADPVPDVLSRSTPPCGTCRHLIWFHGTPATTIILMQYIQGKAGWTFPKIDKYSIVDLYPHPYDPIQGLWENWQPK
jgi:cytidine deaminase